MSTNAASSSFCNPCTPFQDAFEEYATRGDDVKDVRNKFETHFQNSSRSLSLFLRLVPNFETDRFCHSGEILDKAATESTTAIRSHAEAIPRQGSQFGAGIQSQSQVLQSQVIEGWTSSVATITTLPSTMLDYWNYHATIYHRNNN